MRQRCFLFSILLIMTRVVAGMAVMTALTGVSALAAELKWHDFGSEPRTCDLGGVTVKTRVDYGDTNVFHGDHFVLTLQRGTNTVQEFDLISSYGECSLAARGNLLFVKYGVGRGTFVRTEHICVYQLDGLEELADVTCSLYVNQPGKEDPVRVSYRVELRESKKGTTLVLTLPKAYPGCPREKSVFLSK
jgi:hypothetical protein